MKIFKYLLFGLLIFFGVFIYKAPASLLEQYIPQNIAATGISGTIWNGNVQQLTIDKLHLRNATWSTKPFSLIAGNLSTNLSLDSTELSGSLDASYSNNSLSSSDIDLKGELSILSPYLETLGLRINGLFDAKFDSLKVANGIPTHADGVIQTTNTSILGIVPLNLGNVNATFDESENGIQINLSNGDGDLDLTGVINLNQNGAYVADLTFRRNQTTPEQVLETLQLMGRKIDDNAVVLMHSGKLSI